MPQYRDLHGGDEFPNPAPRPRLGHERLLPTATFRQVARITRYVAATLFGNGSTQVSAVEEAWSGVGVEL